MPAILATWEVEIWRITIQGQSEQMVLQDSISKITTAKWIGGVTHMGRAPALQAQSLKFKPQFHEKQTNK
jgi:hypothetical protein